MIWWLGRLSEMTYQLTPVVTEREAAMGRLDGNSIPGRGNGMCQGPKVETSSVDTRTRKVAGEFPGSLVVRTQRFHWACCGPRFNP